MRSLRRSRRGVNLIELLLALALFATAILLIIGIFPTAARSVRQAQGIVVATDLASRRLEELRAVPFAGLAPAVSVIKMTSTSSGGPQVTEYTVQTLVTDRSPDLKHVEVLVSWSTDQARLLRMETYRARYR
ncbi:MAG: prepilin-type N-terminal cleavage/methylation domain-containing protein [Armatimonadetes bacterium]|nr:prepilin-type N-terminal cleavage/methylation domain-containing protein [Armatimonadota bacterium]